MGFRGDRDTLRFRLSAHVALVVFFTGAVAAAGFLYTMWQDGHGMLREHLRWLATAVELLVHDQVSGVDEAGIQKVVDTFVVTERGFHGGEKLENMEYLEVLDSDGRVIATAQGGLEDDEVELVRQMRPSLTVSSAPYEWEKRFDDGCSLYGIAVPLTSGDEQVGTVSVGLCDQPLRRAIAGYAVWSVLFVVFAGLAGVIMGRRISSWAVSPVREIAYGADELARGRLDRRVSTSGPAEIKLLAGSFNTMADSLEQKVAELVSAREEALSLSDKLADSYERVKTSAASLEEANAASGELTERLKVLNRELLSEQKQTDTIVRSIREGIIAIDVNENVILMNPQAEELFETSEDEARGRPVKWLIDRFVKRVEDPVAFMDEFSETVRSPGGDSETFFTLAVPSRRVYHRLSSAIRDESGAFAGRVVTFRDITREHEVDSMKTNFVSTVSHELRTPLTSIKGALTLLKDGRAMMDEGTRREFLHIAEYNTDRLISLITNLLDLSRIDSGSVALNISRLDIGGLAAEFVSKTPFLAGREDVTIRTSFPDTPLVVLGDRDKIEQVFSNLLSNAFKFSPENGEVMFTVEADGDDAVVTVEDDGAGIPPDKLDRVFDRFYQVDMSATRRVGGTGLGLSICRAIVRELGGEIKAHNPARGRGARFVMRLPRVRQTPLDLGFEDGDGGLKDGPAGGDSDVAGDAGKSGAAAVRGHTG